MTGSGDESQDFEKIRTEIQNDDQETKGECKPLGREKLVSEA